MRTERVWGMILGLAAMGLTACGGSPDASKGDSFEAPPADDAGASAEEPSPAPTPDAGHDAGVADTGAAVDAGEAPEAACTLAMWEADGCITPDAGAPEASVPEASLPEAAPAPQPVEPCDAATCGPSPGVPVCINAEVLGCAPYTVGGEVPSGICPTLPDGSQEVPYQCSKVSNDSFGCAGPSAPGLPDNVACCPTGASEYYPSPFCPTTPAK
jgi:hypothetical protein